MCHLVPSRSWCRNWLLATSYELLALARRLDVTLPQGQPARGGRTLPEAESAGRGSSPWDELLVPVPPEEAACRQAGSAGRGSSSEDELPSGPAPDRSAGRPKLCPILVPDLMPGLFVEIRSFHA